MENILVLKNQASTISALADLPDIVAGELQVVGDGKILLTGAEGELQGIERVQFFTKRNDGTIKKSVPIKRRDVTYTNWQEYVAPVNGVYRIGDTSGAGVLPFLTNGEVNITVHNKSYNHNISTQRINVNLIRKVGETESAFVDRVVAALNNTAPRPRTAPYTPFFTAAKIGSGTTLGITFTTTSPDVDLTINMDGMWEGVEVVKVTKPVAGIGLGADVARLEADFSRNEGKSGFIENSELWFKGVADADVAGTYEIITIGFQTKADTATSKMFSARNTVQIAFPSEATAVRTRLATLMGQIFGDAWGGNAAESSIPGLNAPDVDAVDGTVADGTVTP